MNYFSISLVTPIYSSFPKIYVLTTHMKHPETTNNFKTHPTNQIQFYYLISQLLRTSFKYQKRWQLKPLWEICDICHRVLHCQLRLEAAEQMFQMYILSPVLCLFRWDRAEDTLFLSQLCCEHTQRRRKWLWRLDDGKKSSTESIILTAGHACHTQTRILSM